MSDLFEGVEVISVYSVEQAIQDGVLVPLYEGATFMGKPIVVTSALYHDTSVGILTSIFDTYTQWYKEQKPQWKDGWSDLFEMRLQGRNMWIIEDGAAFTMLYPEDY